MKNGVAEAKSRARQEARARREAAHAEHGADAGGLLAKQFFAHITLTRGIVIAGYLPIGSEADPIPILDEAVIHGCSTALAAMSPANELDFSLWKKGDELVSGPYGTRHPASIVPVVPNLIIVPLLAFDRSGKRLGYGGGHFDRILARLRINHTSIHAVGLAFAAQEVDALPYEATDQPLDGVVTEKEVRFFGRMREDIS